MKLGIRIAELGMIQVENSTAGRVAEVHHLLPQSGLRIIEERFKPIHFQLMANPGVAMADLKTVTSMPIALGQCRKFVKKHKLRAVAGADTAGSAQQLAAHAARRHRAPSAPALAAETYGLEILARDIEDEAHGTTRFIVLTAERQPAAAAAGRSLHHELHLQGPQPAGGALQSRRAATPGGVNMTKLESYLENGVAFTATFFYAEVDGPPRGPRPQPAFRRAELSSPTTSRCWASIRPTRSAGGPDAIDQPSPLTSSLSTPMLALIVWSLIMLVWVYATRIPAIQKATIDPADARRSTASLDALPLEGPPGGLQLQPPDGAADDLLRARGLLLPGRPTEPAEPDPGLGLRRASRVAHSLVQATVNVVLVRFAIFMLGSLVLAILAGRDAWALFQPS